MVQVTQDPLAVEFGRDTKRPMCTTSDATARRVQSATAFAREPQIGVPHVTAARSGHLMTP